MTILVNSCDLYEDAWYTFFRLLKTQWQECEQYGIVLNTETKTYDCDFLDVRSVCGGKGVTWSKRLMNCLKQIDSEFVLFFLEDYFLLSKTDNDTFDRALSLIGNNQQIGYIGLKYNRSLTVKGPEYENELKDFPFIERDHLSGGKRINCNTAIWRREWLMHLIRTHESPWEFEKYAERRSRRTKMQALQINNGLLPPVFEYEMLFQFGYGISMKKWLPKNRELFQKYDIKVDLDNLGEMSWETCMSLASEQSPSFVSPKNPPQKKKEKSLRETLYRYKKSIKNINKKIRKKIRAIRSII